MAETSGSNNTDIERSARSSRSSLKQEKAPDGTVGVNEKREDERAAEDVIEAPARDASDFPDGGLRAWIVVAGCAAGTCGTFGLVNGWGVFQEYYARNLLAGTSPSTIAWIGSVQYALVFLPGLVIGKLFDMGWFKVPLGTACALCVAVCFLTAECKEYWQFLLCQGFALGLTCGVVFSSVVSVPAHWFRRNIGVALGAMSIGSSLGGTLFPIIIRNLIDVVGFKWMMRILGFIEVALLGFCFATVQRRLPPTPRKGPFLTLAVFRSLPYTLYVLSSFSTFFGLYTVLTYIDSSTTFLGYSSNFSFYLVAIANGGSALGRIASGLLADRTGNLNIMIPATFIAGILTYAWPFVTSLGGIVAIAIFYGMACGVFVTLLPAPVVKMGDVETVGSRLGICLTFTALGAVAGPPISGAIGAATGGYKYVGIYAGSAVMVCVVLMIWTRYLLLGKKLYGKI